jgi:hypothetical protein
MKWVIAMLALMALPTWAQTARKALPRFENFPAKVTYNGRLATPKIVTPLQKQYQAQILVGIQKAREPNFAGSMIIVQWGCGSQCNMMAVVDANSGEIHLPPISVAQTFQLPVLVKPETVPQSAKVSFRPNSRLMIFEASVGATSKNPQANIYYFDWNGNNGNNWIFLDRQQSH